MNAGPSFYFHDYETFGTDPARDRPAQFAGQRTNDKLEPVGEPLVLHCNPADDMLPQPGACLVTGITPQTARAEGIRECDFIERINDELSVATTCGIGYNSFRFDDEVTRNLLYRNLMDPYRREWANGNSRFDLIDLVRMTYALRPAGIEWPTREDGAPSFRLEDLTAANGIEHGEAHDALGDVRATIALAQLVSRAQPQLWRWGLRLRNKKEAAALLRPLEPVLHTSARFPASRGCTSIVLPLGPHPRFHNQVVVYDLAVEPEPFLEMGLDELEDRLFTPAADLPEGEQRVPLKTIKTNRAPMLAPLSTLTGADKARIALNPLVCMDHARTLEAAPQAVERFRNLVGQHEFEERHDPDLLLYGGFLPDSDRDALQALRAVSPDRWPEPLPKLRDRRLPELLFRFRARNFPDTLSAAEAERWDRFRWRRLTDPDGGASITLEEYEQTLAALEAEGRGGALVDQLRAWPQAIDVPRLKREYG